MSTPASKVIPLRAMNRPLGRASVLGRCATWRCVCQNPVALSGRPGPVSGPTRDTVVRCARCARVYFVIPQDSGMSPPVEVVELFGMPEEPTEEPAGLAQILESPTGPFIPRFPHAASAPASTPASSLPAEKPTV